MSNTNQIICAMEKKVSKIEKFVQSLENEQVMKSKGFQLYRTNTTNTVVMMALLASQQHKIRVYVKPKSITIKGTVWL